VTTFDLPVNQALHDRGDGVFEPMWPEIFDLNGKDWERLCVDNGSTYAVSVAGFREHGFLGPGLRTHLMPRWRSVDIDEPDDLELARLYGRRLYGVGGAQ
jgi:N-acylneuraminate cytidylyltransferase